MKRRRHQHVSKEDGLTLSQRNTLLKKKKTSTTGRDDNSESIPIDLIIEILWRLPLKSIARCRCVSKFWASTLRLPFEEIQVLTLGKTNRWRRIECSVPHRPEGKPICIDGGLYYRASLANDDKIVWFDVRYEKFKFINAVKNYLYCSTLVNYKGKLGLFLCDANGVTRKSKLFELWVLVDAKKHEWSKHVFVLPCLWKNVVAENDRLFFVGVIAGTNEIVLAPEFQCSSDPFNVYYYDFETETFTRVGIQGIYAVTNSPCPRVETFLYHLEDVKLLKMF